MQHKGNQRVEDGEKNEEAWKAWMTCWESEKQKFEFIKLLLKENENNCNYFQVRKWVNNWKNWLKCSLVTASPKSYSKCAAAAAAKLLQSWPALRPHRRQPTRLPRPWDSPSKNTGVGCHFLLQCRKVKSESKGAEEGECFSEVMREAGTESLWRWLKQVYTYFPQHVWHFF